MAKTKYLIIPKLRNLHSLEHAGLLCKEGKINELGEYLKTVNVIDCSEGDYNLFHYAVLQPDVIKYLTNVAYKIYKKFNDGTTELHAAAFAGRSLDIEMAIMLDSTELMATNIRKETLFYYAACGNQFKLVESLINRVPISQYDQAIDDVIEGAKFLAISLKEANQFREAAEVYGVISKYMPLFKFETAEDDDFSDIQRELQTCHVLATEPVSEEKPERKQKSHSFFTQTKFLTGTVVAAAEKWGYEAIAMERDGNCFFYAISDQISLYPDLFEKMYTPQELRHLANKHLRLNIDYYRDYFCVRESEAITIDEHIDNELRKSARNKEWVGHEIIQALAIELNFTLVIISNDDHLPNIFKPLNSIATLCIIHEREHHYESSRIKDLTAIQNGIEVLINAKEILPISVLAQKTERSLSRELSSSNLMLYDDNNEDKDEDSHSDDSRLGRIMESLNNPNFDLESLKQIIQSSSKKINLNAKVRGDKILHMAAEYSSLLIFRYMIEVGDAKLSSFNGKNLFYRALNNPEILRYLTQSDNKLYQRFEKDAAEPEITEIEAAVVYGDWSVIDAILVRCPYLMDLQSDSSRRHSLTYWAALVGGFGTIELLKEHTEFLILAPKRQIILLAEASKGAKKRSDLLELRHNYELAAEAMEAAYQYKKESIALKTGPQDCEDEMELELLSRQCFDTLEYCLHEEERFTDLKHRAKAIEIKKQMIISFNRYNPLGGIAESNLKEQLNEMIVKYEFLKKASAFSLPPTMTFFPRHTEEVKDDEVKESVKDYQIF